MTARIDHTVTSGTFSLDNETVRVENNVWIVGDDQECVIIDAPHDATEILRVVAGRRVVAILCTHAHNDHVGAAPELAAAVTAPVLLHPDDVRCGSSPTMSRPTASCVTATRSRLPA